MTVLTLSLVSVVLASTVRRPEYDSPSFQGTHGVAIVPVGGTGIVVLGGSGGVAGGGTGKTENSSGGGGVDTNGTGKNV